MPQGYDSQTDEIKCMVKCKFKCVSIQEFEAGYIYSFNPVLRDLEGLNKQYWEATPSGSLSLTIIKDKGKLFDVGCDYHLDIYQ